MNLRNKIPMLMVIKDIRNYIDWIKTIDREKENPTSLWNKFNLKHNFFYTVYMPLVLSKEDGELPDTIKRLKIVELLAPIHRYIDDDLQFAEYIVPEFNQFYDEENKPTLAYGIVYRFAFKRLSFGWFVSRSVFVGLLIWAFAKYPIIEWLKSLI